MVFRSTCTFDHSRRKTLHSDVRCCLQRPSGQSLLLHLCACLAYREESLHICKIIQINPFRLKQGEREMLGYNILSRNVLMNEWRLPLYFLNVESIKIYFLYLTILLYWRQICCHFMLFVFFLMDPVSNLNQGLGELIFSLVVVKGNNIHSGSWLCSMLWS